MFIDTILRQSCVLAETFLTSQMLNSTNWRFSSQFQPNSLNNQYSAQCFNFLLFWIADEFTEINVKSVKKTIEVITEERSYFKILRSRKKIRLFTWVSTKAQLVLSPLAGNCKHVILGVSSFACRVFQIYSKSVLCVCQAVYLVQSQPKLAIQVTKAILAVGPAAVEINGAI